MNPVASIFAEITAALEDLHGIAVEGQRSDLTPDDACVLLSQLREGVANLSRLALNGALALP